MRRTKILLLSIAFLILLSTTGTMCPQDNSEFLKALADLKAEVEVLQKQYSEKEYLRAKIQKEISIKDDKIKALKRDNEEVKKRCP